MRLYIIRHGDPDYANDTITPAGHREAQALAQRMAAQGLDRAMSPIPSHPSPGNRKSATAIS